jgi:hypothetical protein
MALVSAVSLHDLVNLNFTVFCEIFLKLRKENDIFVGADPIIFR